MRPVFADPKTDFVFKRIFGSEVHKPLLIELLNALLELEGDRDARGALTLAERQGVEKGMRKGLERGLRKGREEGLQEGRDTGLREGREEGLREGREDGLREAVRALCQAFEIELDAEREAVLASLGAAELKGLQARLLRERRWS